MTRRNMTPEAWTEYAGRLKRARDELGAALSLAVLPAREYDRLRRLQSRLDSLRSRHEELAWRDGAIRDVKVFYPGGNTATAREGSA